MSNRRIFRRAAKQLKVLKNFGPSSVIDDLLNRLRVWSLDPETDEILISPGSISGTDSEYLRIVQAALFDEKIFSRFKSNREYREILEHVNRELGFEYLQVINSYGGLPKSLLDSISRDQCNPFRYTYAGIGRVSPSNLRYGKVALDIKALFGNLDDCQISEIGIGYGGQFQILTKVMNFKSYTFYDLPQVIQLANQYLSRFSPELRNYMSGDCNAPNTEIDLVISNYAFSELDRDLQEIYLKNVILNSKRGYLIYNDIGKGIFDTIHVEEFASRIPGAIIVEEFPLTHPKNKLVIWGHNNLSQIVLRA